MHYILYAGLVWGVRWRGDATPSTAPSSLPALYSFSWGLQTAFTTVALWITIGIVLCFCFYKHVWLFFQFTGLRCTPTWWSST